ncbi:MAG TPA: methyl-accepting chemotaxis protein, partial [Gemmatimonadaceae bacterium]|nr:methyl-accepting chemotaxis protein [Gemmatimonadaceae bacterium]
AGDAGRGFAVVAEEVRSLALRSAEAARQTAQLIEEAVKDADGGAGISGEVARQLREIDAQIARVDEVVSGIALASDEQMRSMEQLGDAVVEMRDATQRTASQSEESAAAATEMSGQAESLRGLVGSFRIGEGGRRSSPRAAVREALVGV